MKIAVFLGPTLTRDEAERELEATYFPPAAQGDVFAVAQDRPWAIAVVDGYFERVPAVWHKEILWALSQGIRVFGAASMGALRAAELAPFGMEGVGAIYHAFASGELEDDDEVAIAHAPESGGYRVLSEAMANIRATLRAAVSAGAISEHTCLELQRLAKGLFYPDRSYAAVLALAERADVSLVERDRLRAFVHTARVDQKRLDALQMLRAIREHAGSASESIRLPWHFEHTDAWEHMLARAPPNRLKEDPEAWRR